MELTLTSPAVLFPAISLLFLAYTNRFLHLSALVRKLHSDWLLGHEPGVRAQIDNLKKRIDLTRWCQAIGIVSLIGCLASMLCLLIDHSSPAIGLFAFSAITMAVSLLLALWEVLISDGALKIYLTEMSDSQDHLQSQDQQP
ncbi:MAG: DUF2721 domain-containing protein [Akkermansiaceae bacterium]